MRVRVLCYVVWERKYIAVCLKRTLRRTECEWGEQRAHADARRARGDVGMIHHSSARQKVSSKNSKKSINENSKFILHNMQKFKKCMQSQYFPWLDRSSFGGPPPTVRVTLAHCSFFEVAFVSTWVLMRWIATTPVPIAPSNSTCPPNPCNQSSHRVLSKKPTTSTGSWKRP